MSEKQPAPPDWVNDVPARYGPDWPDEGRCQHVFEKFGVHGGRSVGERPCGYPTHKGHPCCLFHTEGGRDWMVVREEMERAVGAGICLQEAKLADAHLESAILPGAQLTAVILSGANLRLANLAAADLNMARLSHADLWKANLSRARLIVANVSGANLEAADLSGAWLMQADLSGADLNNVNWLNANLWMANLLGADLRWSHFLDKADLRDATLTDAYLAGAEFSPEADLDGVTWWVDTRTGVIGWFRRAFHTGAPCLRDERELPRKSSKDEQKRKSWFETLAACERIYRQIKQNYQHSGQYDVAGEFHVREMECKRKQLPRWSPMRPVYHVLHFVSDYFESPWRVVVIGLLVILLFALFHGGAGFVWATGKDVPTGGQDIGGTALTLNPFAADWGAMGRALYFSAITFTATGYGDYVPGEGWGQFIAALESLIGVFLMAMFLVCLARKFGRA